MSDSFTVSLMFDQSGLPSPPEGLVIELVTPLTDGGDLDAEGLSRLAARTVTAADGLLVGGGAGRDRFPNQGKGYKMLVFLKINQFLFF